MNKLLYDIKNRFVFYCPREEMQIRGGIQKKKKMANFQHSKQKLFIQYKTFLMDAWMLMKYK